MTSLSDDSLEPSETGAPITSPENNKSNETPKDQAKPIIVSIDKSGVMNFTNQLELGSAARFAITMKIVPDHLRLQKLDNGQMVENIPAVMAALTLCRQRNLTFTAMNEMGFINGKLVCYGPLTTAFCEQHPEYGDQRIYFINESQEIICLANKNLRDFPWACVILSKKKNSEVWNEFVFSVDDAEVAGLLTKTTKMTSTWIKYLKDMLYNKAKNRVQKAQYASSLIGVNQFEDFKYEENGNAEKEVGPTLAQTIEALKNTTIGDSVE